MRTNKSENNRIIDGGQNTEEDLTLTGPNTELLSVRVSKGLYQELERLAKKSKRQLPEVLREMLWFHAFPSNFQSMLQEMKKKHANQPDESAMAFYLSLSPRLAMYQHQADKVLESCQTVKDIEKQVLTLKSKLERLEEEAKLGWQDFLNSTTA